MTEVDKLAADLRAAAIDDLQQAYDMLFEARERIRSARYYVAAMEGDNSYPARMLASVCVDGDIDAVSSAIVSLK